MKENTRNSIGLIVLLIILLGGYLFLAFSCARRPQPSDREAERVSDKQPAVLLSDSVASVKESSIPTPYDMPRPGLFQRVAAAIAPGKATVGKTKCKGCTIVVGTGNTVSQNGKKGTAAVGENATAAGAGSQQATDSSTLTSAGTGNAATQQGDGNKLEQTATTEEAPGVGATIAGKLTGPLGIVLGAAAGIGILVFILRRRAKRAAENIV